VKGVPADCRSDIFAFGCVLFEMLTGRRAFAGGSASEVLTQVVEREPNWTLLPSSVPASIERLLRLCLEKDPPRRRQSAGDVRVDLERAQSEPTVAVPRARSRWTSTLLAAAAVTLVAGTAVVMWVALRNRDTAAPEMRFQVETPQMPGLDPMHFALSPEGDLVFAAPATVNGTSQLYLRTRNATNPQPISGTEGARYPFWSPDGRSIGFFASSKVFRVDLAGGRPQALAPAINPMGGAWGKDGTILLSPTTVSPLLRVPASSGPLVAATQLQSPHQSNHRWPSFLPDGRHFLFYVAADEESGIYLGSLDGGPAKRLTAADSGGVFLPPDRILFVQEGKLVARHFDATRGELSGDPVTLAAPVSVTNNLGWFSTSAAGVVAFRSGTVAPRQMTWFDRTGKVLSVGADVNGPSVSPDQRYLAFDRTINANRDVWTMDLVRGGVTPLTRHPRVDGFPVWSHDGSQVAFHSQRNGTFDIWIKPSSGSGDEQLLVSTPANEWPLDWSKDGRFLLFQRCDENYSSADLFALPMTGESRTPIVVANGPFEENIGSFSPDARWVTYQTDESGRPEIVVKAFQRPSGIIHVSTDGGVAPRWSADGREIYFVSPDGKMMAAAVSFSGSTLDIGKPVALFQTHIVGQTFTFQYAVTRDARFVMADRQVEQGSASPITVLFNWKP
jgi:Tol biopolymer transport system component